MTDTKCFSRYSFSLLILLSSLPYLLVQVSAFTPPTSQIGVQKLQVGKSYSTSSSTRSSTISSTSTSLKSTTKENEDSFTPRRSFLGKSLAAPFIAIAAATSTNFPSPLIANALEGSAATANAEITSKIFVQLKGLPSETDTFEEDVITIGLFGKDSSQPVSILEQLVSPAGYFAKCKPKEIRTLQREQLEANKVYNSCMEAQDTKGVNYDLSTVWRIVKNERIDLGAVSGKYIAREYPTYEGSNSLKHDAEGVVSVRIGNDGGFGFTIYTGTGSQKTALDETNIVVGRVVSGMDVVRKLNLVPVVKNSLAGDDISKRSAPSRACRYGGKESFCSEFKPLKKVSIFNTGMTN